MAKVSKEIAKVVNAGAIVVPTTKKEVGTTIAQLKEQLALLQGEGAEKTDLDMSLGGVKVKDMTKVGQLLKTSSNVFAQATAYDTEIKRYNLQEMNIKPFELDGRTIDKWQKAISIQINSVINQSQIAKIQSAITELEKHLSESEKLANTLKGITGSVTSYIE